MPEILDYEGSNYRTDFWEGKGRDYEDQVERIAIRRLLPASGQRLLDVGAGFGRYTNLFEGYQQVVLMDYSRSQLEYAHQTYGDAGFLYVAADVYNMPFAPGLFDGAVMIRVLHHMQQPPAALSSIRRVMRQHGVFVLEYANKQNLKAILRWMLRRQDWNPFDLSPVEFVKLNFDFHPRYITRTLAAAGFTSGQTLTASHFRVGLIKRLVPSAILVALDSVFQWSGELWQLTPSVFVRNIAAGADQAAPDGAFWRCPACGGYDLSEKGDTISCRCGKRWQRQNGVWDFK